MKFKSSAMGRNLYLFSFSFPYGKGESFLAEESTYLAKRFNSVYVIPLSKETGEIQITPSNFIVSDPLLPFPLKQKRKLIMKGVFCCSPLFFAIPLFFKEKAYKSGTRVWKFFTALLLFRAAYAALQFSPQSEDIFYFYWGDKSAMLIPFLKKKYKNKCVVRFHNGDLYESRHNSLFTLRKEIFEQIDLAAPISNDGKQYLQKKYKKSAPLQIETHRLGVNSHGVNPKKTDPVFQLVSCSNIIPIKQLSLIAQSLKYIDFPVQWTHIGDGKDRQLLEEEIKTIPLLHTVNLLGFQPNNQVLLIYKEQHFDLFINTSSAERVPVSIMEALSFGIPVMATDVGGTAEIVDDTVGKLLPADITPEEIARYISELYHLPSMDSLRGNAISRWQQICDANHNYSTFCDRLDSL